MGYASGLNDAEFARKTRPGDDPAAAFLVGPQLHMLEGAARVTPLKMSFDREAGRFEGEFRWDHSWEAHAHRQKFGAADDPSCWTRASPRCTASGCRGSANGPCRRWAATAGRAMCASWKTAWNVPRFSAPTGILTSRSFV